MHDTRPVISIEQRRKLLKGALAASGVVTMGYSGSALASFQCVAQVRTSGVATLPATQFTMTEPTTASGNSWAWVKVTIERYRQAAPLNGVNGLQCTNSGSSNRFDAFTLNNTFYRIQPGTPPTLITPPATYCKDTDQTGYPKAGWVLAYFDDSGNLTGTYPTYTTAGIGQTPAAQSCLASVNPGLNLSNFTFGG